MSLLALTVAGWRRLRDTPGAVNAMPFLAPGPYAVTVEVAGFKRYLHSGIEVGTNERIAEDIRLQVGSSSESVTVTAESPLVSAMTASAGQVITTQEVANLPMNGNTPLALARNAMGVIPKQKHLLNEVKPYDVSSAVDISLGGANSGSNEYLLDGAPNMSSAARAGAFSPSMDAVDEVKVELYQVDAAYGDTLGGTVNITTKSGTNQFHGSLYEFNQTSALAANQFFLNSAGQQQPIIWGGVLDDVHTFSPTLPMDSRLGFTRSFSSSFIKSAGFDPTQLGFPSYMGTFSLREAMPRINFSDTSTGTSNYSGLSTSPGSVAPFTSIQWFTSLTKVTGRHTLKAGFDFRRYDANSLSAGYSAGTFTFGTTWMTAGTGASTQPFGGSMASFILGLPTAGQFDVNTGYAYRSYLFGFFLQDDWRVTPTLTINVGLRIEHETPIVERYNHIVNGFNPAALNAVAQAAAAAYAKAPMSQLSASAFSALGGLTFASSSDRSGYSLPAFFPSPRVGLSWAPSALHGKTVFRGGFGIFNNSIGAYLTGPNTGFSQTTNLVPTNDSYVTPYATLSNPYPGGSIQTPAGSALGVNSNLGNSISFYTSNITNPYRPDRDYEYLAINRELRRQHQNLIEETLTNLQAVATVTRDATTDLLTINREFSASIVLARCTATPTGRLRWKIRLDTILHPDITIAARMTCNNDAKTRGYSAEQISAKIDLDRAYVCSITHLLERGEERLIDAVERGTLPLSIAVRISAATDHDVQQALREAYESGDFRGQKLISVKRLLAQRAKDGKTLTPQRVGPKRLNAQAIIRAYKSATAEQRAFRARANRTQERLLVITSALRQLLADDRFTTLL